MFLFHVSQLYRMYKDACSNFIEIMFSWADLNNVCCLSVHTAVWRRKHLLSRCSRSSQFPAISHVCSTSFLTTWTSTLNKKYFCRSRRIPPAKDKSSCRFRLKWKLLQGSYIKYIFIHFHFYRSAQFILHLKSQKAHS